MKKTCLFILLMPALISSAQLDNSFYHSPLSGVTVLSGSFGEPRTSHFHAGIDFKPQRGWGLDSIYATQKGHISRIVVSPDGYGNALYIDHPDGHTSVYAHLKAFVPKVRRYIESIMYDKQVYQINHFPQADVFPVNAGEVLGIMGNTGRSSGPHLHFELRKTDGQLPQNPFIYGIKPSDDRAPVIKGVMIYYLTPDDEVMHQQYYPASPIGENQYALGSKEIVAGHLMVGIGLHTYDTMNGASNHNGIYGLKCAVDGLQSFAFTLDALNFSTTKYLHSHMDYGAKLDRKYIVKCYKEAHNPLDLYTTDDQLGKIFLFENLPRYIHLEAKDFEGNTSSLSFSIIRSEQLMHPIKDEPGKIRINPEDSLILGNDVHEVRIMPGTLVSPDRLSFLNPGFGVFDLKQDHAIPVFNPINLTTRVDRKDTQWIYASINPKGETISHGGYWPTDTTFVTEINDLDSIFILKDTVPPSIRLVRLPSKEQPFLTVEIKDEAEAVKASDRLKFDIFIDDEWFLCEYDIKNHRLRGKMIISPNGQVHNLRVSASDGVGNVAVLNESFIY